MVVLRRIGRMDGGRGGSQEMIDMDLGESRGWNYMVMRDAIREEKNWRGIVFGGDSGRKTSGIG